MHNVIKGGGCGCIDLIFTLKLGGGGGASTDEKWERERTKTPTAVGDNQGNTHPLIYVGGKFIRLVGNDACGMEMTYMILLLNISRADKITECPTIPISLGLSRFCLKIPNPGATLVEIGKSWFWISAPTSNEPRRQFHCNTIFLWGTVPNMRIILPSLLTEIFDWECWK